MLIHDFLTLVRRGMPGTGSLAWQGEESEPEGGLTRPLQAEIANA